MIMPPKKKKEKKKQTAYLIKGNKDNVWFNGTTHLKKVKCPWQRIPRVDDFWKKWHTCKHGDSRGLGNYLV